MTEPTANRNRTRCSVGRVWWIGGLALALAPLTARATDPPPLGPTAVEDTPTVSEPVPVRREPPGVALMPSPDRYEFEPQWVDGPLPVTLAPQPITSSTTTTTATATTTTTTTVTTITTVEPGASRDQPPVPASVRPDDDMPRPYGSVSLDASRIWKGAGLTLGLRGGFQLAEGRASIGGSLRSLVYRHGPTIFGASGTPYRLKMTYGGLDLGLVFIRREYVDFGLDSMVGGGVACLARSNYASHRGCVDAVRLFTVDEGLFVRVIAAKWMRIGLTAGFRYIRAGKWKDIPPQQDHGPFGPGGRASLSSPYVGLTIDFGRFLR